MAQVSYYWLYWLYIEIEVSSTSKCITQVVIVGMDNTLIIN